MKFKTHRYLTKKGLIEANEAASREKRNKTIYKHKIAPLPEDFIFVVAMVLYHSKKEVRLGITMNLEGSMALLDMSLTRFNSLPISKEFEDGRIEFEPQEDTEKRRPYPNGREWKEVEYKQPIRRQSKFRKLVLKAYSNKCAICGVDSLALLRAAHIVPVVIGNDDTIQNGICLCANHEIAFDFGLLKIHPNGVAYIYDEQGNEIESIIIRFPKNLENFPLPQNLKKKLRLVNK